MTAADDSSGRLVPGQPAPDLRLLDADERPVSLHDFRGQRVVIYFYPAANTPGCTTQACDFRDNLALLDGAGYTVLGISPDQPAKLRRFRDQHRLSFPLLSDPQHQALSAYGAWGEKNRYGKRSFGVIRSTFVVDERGDIEAAQYSVRATGHVAALLRRLGLAAASDQPGSG